MNGIMFFMSDFNFFIHKSLKYYPPIGTIDVIAPIVFTNYLHLAIKKGNPFGLPQTLVLKKVMCHFFSGFIVSPV